MSTLQDKFEDALMGKKEELLNFLKMSLKETDWSKNIANTCRDLIKERGLDQVSIEEIVRELIPGAKQAIPETVYNELQDKIKKSLSR